MSVTHRVFVLGVDGQPLGPTTPARARKLLRGGAAKKVWSKFGTFGIQLLVETRRSVPETALGVDPGARFEGYAVVSGDENCLAVKLDLPDKKRHAAKLKKRRQLRQARRSRKCRRRPCRAANRSRTGFLPPSQAVVVGARLKVLRELFRCYPIAVVGLEEVHFNHAAKRWGANFTTAEMGKTIIQAFFRERGVALLTFRGFETRELRATYGYRKWKNRGDDRFEAHCSDALALACEVSCRSRVEPGEFVIVDETYRPIRRQLHDTQPARGGDRVGYSRGAVFGLRKGIMVGTRGGKRGRLCGVDRGAYRYVDESGRRHTARGLSWISTHFMTRGV